MPSQTPHSVDARELVDRFLDDAVARLASDLHLEPMADGYELRFRIDGLLETIERFDATTGRSAVARLMVMAQLLTYRQDVPQEGRLQVEPPSVGKIEMRLAVMPTSNGLRAVVRLPAELTQPRSLDELHLPPMVLDGLKSFAQSNAGMLLLTGPAGSGKTTTIYALLEYMVEQCQGLSIVSLEDPVERDLPGVTQIEVSPFGELTYERALRSMLRQDPQVLVLGEIRDDKTATVALQAALSGHRMISTLHAGTPGGAVSRLLEMGIEPYQVTSAVYGVVAMRLIRAWNSDENRYVGRLPVAEFAIFDGEVRDAVLQRADAGTIQSLLTAQPGYLSLRDSAEILVEGRMTKRDEGSRCRCR